MTVLAPSPDPAGRATRAFPIVASTPGAWIGRTGRDQVRKTIRRILCLKLDHIGDMLIAAPALRMLRTSFAEAEITLVCGPWNAGLAHRLGIADTIITADVYAENSMLHLDRVAQARRVRDAMEKLLQLDLGHFDLAVDMRRDEDCRNVLKLFSADIYAGFGELSAFPFLDASIPLPRDTYNTGPTSALLLPSDFSTGTGLSISAYGLHLERLARLDIEIRCEPATSSGDPRRLGVAISAIEVRTGALTNGHDQPAVMEFPVNGRTSDRTVFGEGWEPAEPWGRWTNAERATLTLHFPATVAEVELTVRAHGHTAAAFPRSMVEVAAGEQAARHEFQWGDHPVRMTLPCRAQLAPAAAKSNPILLRAGHIKGQLTLAVLQAAPRAPLILRVRGTQPPHTITSVPAAVPADFVGVLEIPFQFEHFDCAEPILVEIESYETERTETLGIMSVELGCERERPSKLPIAHVEEQLQELAAMVALRYARGPGYPKDAEASSHDIECRLSARRPGSSAAAASGLLARRKAEGRRLIGIAVGANKVTKLWPMPYFHDLCHRLLDVPEVDLVFVGGPQEAAPVRTLVKRLGAGERLLDLCSCCSIEDFGEVVEALDGYVGLDTGTTHFAGRLGVKTVALFAYTHHPREWGPVGKNSSWILAEVPCGGCLLTDTADCTFGHRCMTGLTPADVWPVIAARLL